MVTVWQTGHGCCGAAWPMVTVQQGGKRGNDGMKNGHCAGGTIADRGAAGKGHSLMRGELQMVVPGATDGRKQGEETSISGNAI